MVGVSAWYINVPDSIPPIATDDPGGLPERSQAEGSVAAKRQPGLAVTVRPTPHTETDSSQRPTPHTETDSSQNLILNLKWFRN
jgi:hypothetical protein